MNPSTSQSLSGEGAGAAAGGAAGGTGSGGGSAPSDHKRAAEQARKKALRRAEQKLRKLDQKQAEIMARATLTPNTKIGLAMTAVIIIATWWHALGEMWMRWFPAWNKMELSFMDRLTKGDSYYTHGPLVPLVSGVIAYLIFNRVGLPSKRTMESAWVGGVLLGASLLLQLMAAWADVTFVAGFAMIGVLGGLVMLWGGFPLARAYWLPVAFLVFMVPLPMSLVADINFQLKQIAGGTALWITNQVFDIPAIMTGSQVILPNDPITGEPKTLVVENTCSGLRSLISLICFASLFALICRVKGFWRLFMLLLAGPIAILMNIIRITTLNVTAHYWSVEQAGPGGIVHDMSGLIVFGIALGIMFGFESGIIWLSKTLKQNWTDPKLLGYLDDLPKVASQPLRTLQPAPLIAFAFVALCSTMLALEAETMNRTDVAKQAVQQGLVMGGVSYEHQDREMDELTKAILQTNDYLCRRFENPKNPLDVVDMTIVFSANNRKGTHPPEVCLEGGGARVVTKQLHDVPLISLDAPADQGATVQAASMTGGGGSAPANRTIVMRELITENRGHMMYHLYTYKCGDAYTPNFFTQQLTIVINSILSRNTAGALIRFDVPMLDKDPDAARVKALAAASRLMAQVDKGLP